MRSSLLAAAIIAAGFGAVGLAGGRHFGFDLGRVDVGMVCALKERVASGEGLWVSPLIGNGDPLLAKPEAQVFYPPRLLGLLVEADLAVFLYVVFHLAAAAAACAWLARTFRVRPIGAALAGVAFALSGTVLDLVTHSHYLAAAAWLPFVWAACRRGLRNRAGPWALLATGAGLIALLLAGEPQGFCIASALVVFEVAMLCVRTGGRSRALALRFALIPFVALAVAMVQWAGVLGEVQLGSRSGPLPHPEALMWSFSQPLWFATIVPGLLTQRAWPFPNLWHVWHGSVSEHYPWNPQPYWGALFLVCAGCGLALKRARVASGVFLTAMLFALGSLTPVLPTLMKVFPPLALFRYPAKYLVIAGLAGAVVAALGIQQVVRRRRPRRMLFGALGSVFVALLAGGWIATVAWQSNLDLIPWLVEPKDWRPEFPRLSEVLGRLLLQGLAPLVIAMLITFAMPRLRSLLPGLVVVDLLLAAPYATFIGKGLAPGPSPLAAARPPKSMVLCVDPALESHLFGLASGRVEWDQALFQRTHLLPELNACDGIVAAIPYSALEVSLAFQLVRGVINGRMNAARALGCTDLLADTPSIDEPGTPVARLPVRVPEHPELAERSWHVNVFKVEDPLPEFFVAKGPVLAASEADAVQRIAVGSTSGDLLQVVDDPLKRLAAGQPLPAGAAAGIFEGTWLARQHAVVKCQGSGGAVVGVRTSFHVGWAATQAGRALPVVRVAGSHVGAVVEDVAAGEIDFVYSSPGFRLGLLASALGAAAFAALFLWERRARARSNSTVAPAISAPASSPGVA